ncbi:MAG: AAA family ATPase [Smithella sp.]
MYCDYWNLTKPPFDNVPDASMYVDCHESMENVISETIFAIKEGNECLTVIVGEVGLGKTLSLRVIIDSLEPDKYKVALITNPALSFIQLLREIIGQITGKQCMEKKKVDLLEIFNNLLFETADQGKKIVIVIDEANVLSPSNLDDLRLLTNMQDDERNLFTLLLVGQMEFAKTLEHPKRANLFQRIGTYGHLEKLPSQEAVRDYIESRLRIAGTERKIFEDDAIPVIWEFSEHGIPRLINKICKLCMKAGETNEFKTISGEVAEAIADRFQKLGKTSKPQRRPEPELPEKKIKETESKKIPKAPRAATPIEEVPAPKAPVPPKWEEPSPVQPRMSIPRPTHPQMEELRPAPPRMAAPEPPSVNPATPQREEAAPVQPRVSIPRPIHPQMEEIKPVPPRTATPEPPAIEPVIPQREEAAPVQPRVSIPRPIPQMEELRPATPRMAAPEPPSVEPLTPQWEEAAIPVQPRVSIPRPIHPQMEELKPVPPRTAMPQPPVPSPVPSQMEGIRPVAPRMVAPGPEPIAPVPPRREETVPVPPRTAMPEPPMPGPVPSQMEEIRPVAPRMVAPRPAPVASVPPRREEAVPVPPRTVPLAKPSANYVPSQDAPAARNIATPVAHQREEAATEGQLIKEDNEIYEDVLIGQQTIKLTIPAHVIKQAQLATPENKNKLAGYWSAQILKENPSLTHSSLADPVSLWFDVKNVILKKFNIRSNTSAM